MSLQLSERRLRARIGGYQRAALYDGREVTAKARERFHNGFVEKARVAAQAAGKQLSEAEIERRGEALRRAHFARLALRAIQARKKTASTPSNVEAVPPVDAKEARTSGTSQT